MVFNSHIFIFVFLPLTVVGYYILNHFRKYRWAQVFLAAASLVFYGYFNVFYVLLLVGSILLNYFLYRNRNAKAKKSLLIIGIVMNLGLLGYFKYFNFFTENINSIFHTSFVLRNILLPLGISFFTFQQISFLVDAYRGEAEGYELAEYVLFVVFFPQLVAGPIVQHSEMIPQFRNLDNKRPEAEWIIRGLKLFTLGLAKKILLADMFAEVVNWGFEYYYVMDSTHATLAAVLFTLQLYFDFSGYCDMAKGIGYLFHVVLPTNFNSPYKSGGIIEFWRRWHITLGRFFTKYVYIPLGGSRKGKVRTCLNSFIVFFLSGFWHGAAWTFVLWGVMHGVGYIVDYIGKPLFRFVPKAIRTAVTFVYVCLAFVAFRAESLKGMLGMYKAIFAGNWQRLQVFLAPDELQLAMKFIHIDLLPGAAYYPMIFFLLFSFYLVFFGKNSEERVDRKCLGIGNGIAYGILLLYCIVNLSKVSTFLYFNF